MQQAAYRPDIDGLRAFAVLAVIFFHFRFAGFSGGYVGVDVFFVISGYLITQILVREHDAGNYSIVRFYERRVRRIIPALLAVIGVTLAAGWWLLSPVEYGDLGKATLSALAFISNVKFWLGSNYFDAAAVRPLLHTWSLAVEEQFYIAYPVILALLYRYAKRWIPAAIVGALLASFLLSAVGAFWSPSATFFLIPTRAWELMVGAALALGLVPAIHSRALAEAAALAGAAMIAVTVAFYDERTYFPGASALLPCIGTALLIHSGSDQATRLKALLSWRPIVVVGLMSYSLYLYHFPVHVFAVRFALRELTMVEALVAIGLTFFLGFLSWRYVERPFRQRGRFDRKQIFLAALIGSVALAALAAATVAAKGFPQRYAATELRLFDAASDMAVNGRDCLNLPVAATATAAPCRLGAKREGSSFGDFLVVGDSHAAALAPAIDLAAARLGRSGTMVSYNACAPLLGVEAPALSWRDARGCRDRAAQWLEAARQPSVRTIVLAGFWSAHLQAWGEGRRDPERYMADALGRTLAALPGKQIVLLLDVPHASMPPGTQAVFARRFGRPLERLQSGSNDQAAAIIRRSAATGAKVIDLSAPLCREPCTGIDARGRPILIDGNHVGASIARERLTPVLTEALRP